MKSVGHEPMIIQYNVHPLTWPSDRATEKSVYSDLASVNTIQHSYKLLVQIQEHFTPLIKNLHHRRCVSLRTTPIFSVGFIIKLFVVVIILNDLITCLKTEIITISKQTKGRDRLPKMCKKSVGCNDEHQDKEISYFLSQAQFQQLTL